MPHARADATGRVLSAAQLARWLETRPAQRLFHLHTVGHEEPGWWARLADSGWVLEQLRVIREASAAATIPPPNRGLTRVRVLDVRCGVRSTEADDDFLMVDDEHAVRLVYDDHGRFAVAFAAPASGLDRYRFIRDSAWAAGRP